MSRGLKYLVEDVDRYGVVRYYVRIPGRPKVRLVCDPDTPEFDAEYLLAFERSTGLIEPPPQIEIPRAENGWQYLYLISAHSGPVKIGITADPEQRLADLQTGNPRPLSLKQLYLLPTESAAKLERTVLQNNRKFRLCGEWFDLSVDELVALIAQASRRMRVTLSTNLDLIHPIQSAAA